MSIWFYNTLFNIKYWYLFSTTDRPFRLYRRRTRWCQPLRHSCPFWLSCQPRLIQLCLRNIKGNPRRRSWSLEERWIRTRSHWSHRIILIPITRRREHCCSICCQRIRFPTNWWPHPTTTTNPRLDPKGS